MRACVCAHIFVCIIYMSVCVCVHTCVRACVRACVHVLVCELVGTRGYGVYVC